MNVRPQAVIEGMRRGMLGFRLEGFAGTLSDTILNVDVPTEYAQRWLINMCGIKYRSRGTIQDLQATTQPNGAAGVCIPTDPDNQVNVGISNFKVQLQWGVAGATEQVIMDYPSQGMSVAVTAASIRANIMQSGLSAGVLVPQGRLAGFIAPLDVSRDSIIPPPLFTTPFLALNTPGLAGSVFFDIPTRATGYRPLLPRSTLVYYNIGLDLFQCHQACNPIACYILTRSPT